MGEVRIRYEDSEFCLRFSYGYREHSLSLPLIKQRSAKRANYLRNEGYYIKKKMLSALKKFYFKDEAVFSMYMNDHAFFGVDLDSFIFNNDDQDLELLDSEICFPHEDSYDPKFRLLIIKYRIIEALIDFIKEINSEDKFNRAYNYLIMNRYYILVEFQDNADYRYDFDGNYLSNKLEDEILNALDQWVKLCEMKESNFFRQERKLDREWEIERAIFEYNESKKKNRIRRFLYKNKAVVLRERYASWFIARYDLKNASILSGGFFDWFRKKFINKNSISQNNTGDIGYLDIDFNNKDAFKIISKQRWPLYLIFSILICLSLAAVWMGSRIHSLFFPDIFGLGNKSIILICVYFLFIIFINLYIFYKPALSMRLQLPRLISGIIIGYLFIIGSGSFSTIISCGISDNPYSQWSIVTYFAKGILPMIVSAWYLTVEIYKVQKDRYIETFHIGKWDTRQRVLRILFQGLTYSLIIGVIFSDLFGYSIIGNGVNELDYFEGVFGRIYPLAVLVCAPTALFIGIFTQLLWEDKPITHPI